MKEPFSEERLLEAAENKLTIKVPVKRLVIDNVREYTEEAVKARAASMSAVGLLVAIIISTKGVVFDGAGRLLAAMMLGWAEINATVIKSDLTPSEWKIRQLTTSIHREKLTDWQLYENCMTLLGLRTEWKQVDLAKHLAVEEPTISRWMSPSKNTVKAREALKSGLIGFTETTRLSRLPEEEKDLILASVLDGTTRTRDELDRVVRERTKKPSAKTDGDARVTRMKAVLSGVTVTLASKSLDMTTLIASLGELIKLARKADRDRLDVRTFEAILRDQAKGAEGQEDRAA